MATDIKISQMPSATSLAGTELIPIVQNGTNKTTTPAKIKEGLATVAQLGNKVDKDGNKVLSEQDFTTKLKTKLDGIEANANNYVHPTTAGNKHIPAEGSAGQILKWSAAGTAVWGDEKTYSEATASAAGLMRAADKAKLDGVAAQANKYEHPANHPASIITQDATHKFVTDAEKATWNGKANTEDIPDVSGFATKTELNTKLNTSTYNTDKATFATKKEIGDINTILDTINGEVI